MQLTIFTLPIIHTVYPSKFCINAAISLGTTTISKRNWKTMVVENWKINKVYFRQCDDDIFLAVSIKDTIKKTVDHTTSHPRK